MNISFEVMMMLKAVNQITGPVRDAMRTIQQLGQTAQNVAKQTSSLNPVQGWEEKINRVADAAKRIGKELRDTGKNISEQGEKLQHSGFKNMIEGASMAAPILAMTNKAAELQMRKTSMRMSGISSEGVGQLMEQADQYTQWSVFKKPELAEMFLTMRKSGMIEENMLRGSESLTKLAELEFIRSNGSVSGPQTAKILSQMAERGGILQDPDINRWKDFLEIVNQVTTITTAGLPELHESSKYLEPVTRIAGWNEKDVMMSQGIAARFGLEGSIAGTDLKDMIERLNNYKWFHEGRPSQQLQAMQDLGWLEGAQTHVNKQGRTVFDTAGKSVFLNPDGSYKNMLEVFGQFAKSWEKYKDLPDGRAKFAADMTRVLGEQGQKTANLVSMNYPVIQQMMAEAQKVKPIDSQVDEYTKQYIQNYNAFKSSLENLEIEAGNLMLPSMTEAVQTLREWVAAARQFTNEHPGMVSGILKFLVAMGALKVVIGAAQIVFGTLMTTLGGGMKVFGWLSTGFGWIITRAMGLVNAFQYFRGMGAGVFEALWKGAQWAFPWLGKLSGWVSRFTIQWLVSAARIGAGWLIAMGPVGWIILGVTALIAAGVWAWQTNFWGFRDNCLAIWEELKQKPYLVFAFLNPIISTATWLWTSNFMGFRDKCIWVWESICGIVQQAIAWIGNYIDKVKDALGLSQKMSTFHGPIRGVELSTGNTPFVGSGNRNNSVTINQTNNINGLDGNEARDFTNQKLEVPGKYKSDDNNPSYAW